MNDQSIPQSIVAIFDERLDCLLQEELAALGWSQADMALFYDSPLPALIKQIVISTVIKVWCLEKQKGVNGYPAPATGRIPIKAPLFKTISIEHDSTSKQDLPFGFFVDVN